MLSAKLFARMHLGYFDCQHGRGLYRLTHGGQRVSRFGLALTNDGSARQSMGGQDSRALDQAVRRAERGRLRPGGHHHHRLQHSSTSVDPW